MELSEAIKKRRSVRNYKINTVSWNLIAEVLDAGRQAPAAGNLQNFYFIVVRNKEKKQELAKASHDQNWMNKAPVHIVVCSDETKLIRLYGERGEDLYSPQNTAAAIQNILLKATDLSLATCWVGAFNEKKVIEIMEINKENVRPQAIITLGYPKTTPKQPLKDDLNLITYFDQWKKKERIEYRNIPIEKPVKSNLNKVKNILKRRKKKN